MSEISLNERQETRVNFLKKDKDQMLKRLEDLEDRLYSAKATLQVLLSDSAKVFPDHLNSKILDYLIEEKNVLTRRLSEVSVENEETIKKSEDQKQKLKEVLNRESKIESEMSLKYKAVLQESLDKEQIIRGLGSKSEKLNKEYKELAKNRLNSSINPCFIPDLLQKKEQALARVLKKVYEYELNLEVTNKHIQKDIENSFNELSKINPSLKYPSYLGSLQSKLNPEVKNLLQGDIRGKIDVSNLNFIFKLPKESETNEKITKKLEEGFIKLDSLCNELRNAEVVNFSLKEDRKNFIKVENHLRKRYSKQATYKPVYVNSFRNIKKHKRVVSNPLDYCAKESDYKEKAQDKKENDSNELEEFSSVEDNNFYVAEDSIIDEILKI